MKFIIIARIITGKTNRCLDNRGMIVRGAGFVDFEFEKGKRKVFLFLPSNERLDCFLLNGGLREGFQPKEKKKS